MTELETRKLKPGDRVVYRIGDRELSRGTVKAAYLVAFKVKWDDDEAPQTINYNEAHYIFPVVS